MAVVILWLNLPPLNKELYIKIKENVFKFFFKLKYLDFTFIKFMTKNIIFQSLRKI